MIKKFLKKVIGTRNDRVLRVLSKNVAKINALEPSIKALSDTALGAKTQEFRERFKKGETLDDLLPEAFAVVREASMRTLGQRHFDVQLIGGMVLHSGKIAEMRTGEGKTLVATLPAYLNSLSGSSVHIVTVNDYLAQRDADWMRPIYNLLGLSVGVILTNQDRDGKKAAYLNDITYGTNNEFGFDYLRDNMAFSLEDKMQRDLSFAIVDEVDSILIDEARTPLIISGPSEDSSDLYVRINKIIPLLTKQTDEKGPGDYTLDEKMKQAYFTESGHQRVEELLLEHNILRSQESLYDSANIKLMHYLAAALRAHTLFHRDVDYIVRNGEVIIVDEHTGRTMDGRRWSDGLHQAMEAKEGVAIRNENQTLASITFQNYFRLYKKLSGMTGTADTEAYEFQQIYGLEVIVIPTNQPMIRKDFGDQIYLTADAKYRAVIADIKKARERQQPVLVGTSSIENSEILSNLLNKEKIPHAVLNAKQHDREAKIIAEAGRPGTVTIATNMAGRGTDIVLGGSLAAELAALETPTQEEIAAHKAEWQVRHDQVVSAGGLHIVGSERHESRRIDNQLRGRSGRQGDPGSSRFYLSLDDNLLRIFASDKLAPIMKRLGLRDNEAIEHPFVTQAVEKAQRKVEGHNFDIRKQLLEYDNVANEQRRIVYTERDELMRRENVSDTITSIREDVINSIMNTHIPPESLEEQWDVPGLEKNLQETLGLAMPVAEWLKNEEGLNETTVRERITENAAKAYAEKTKQIGEEVMPQLEKSIMLQSLDMHWKEHLAAMDHLREGIHLRGYAQQNPKQEYKRESFKMFTSMLESVKHTVLQTLYSVRVRSPEEVAEIEEQRRLEHEAEENRLRFLHSDMGSVLQPNQDNVVDRSSKAGKGENVLLSSGEEPFMRQEPKVGRNDPCPCGSGKKYKQCCGKL
ncbi:MAG: preprotein translocase subunit SecA [Gammaproteobacteria bacterium]